MSHRREIAPDGTIRCSACAALLPLAAFHADASSVHGVRTRCKTCIAAAPRKPRYARRRPVKVNAEGLVWCRLCDAYLPPHRFNRHSRDDSFQTYCREHQVETKRAWHLAKAQTVAKPAAAPKPVPPPVVPPPKPTGVTVPRRASKPAPVSAPTPPTKTIVVIKPSPRPKTLPMGDPALCVHPARPCDALDGLSLIADLHAGNICGAIVRSWTATVNADARGLVQPRFETARSRDLFDEMLSVRTGHRERRQSA